MKDHIKILGMTYKAAEVECVNKEEMRKGEINFLTNEIRIDKNMPDDLKEQVLIHEVLHAIFDLLGYETFAQTKTRCKALQPPYTKYLKKTPDRRI